METKKLIKKLIYSGEIKLLTGMHIGGTNSAFGIGGPDQMVIRNPITNKPYIPGSSLKGKMRSLIELLDGNSEDVRMGKIKHGPTSNLKTRSGRLFGTANNDETQQRPSRLLVRDADLLVANEDEFKNTDLPYTEAKTEVVIDRVTSNAMPRTFERVPAGAKFQFNMVLNIFSDEDEKELKDTVTQAINLLKDDYIGGKGSRGYGQIDINYKVEERAPDFYEKSVS